MISPLEAKEQVLCDGPQISGEIEIENISITEVEIRQKDLLPVFNHFHGIQSPWGDR